MTTTPFIVTGQEAGLDDRQYIRRLRELIGDVPKPADEQGSGLGNALRYNMQVVPINDDDTLSIVVAGVTQAIITTPAPAGGQVYVDFDTGRLVFGTPPAAGSNNITVLKNTVRWRDSTLKEALMDGARNMWPKLGRLYTDSTSVAIQTLVWDYALPPIFFDPNIRLTDVAVREIPASANRFYPITGWERVGLGTLRVPPSQSFSPGAQLQLTYEAPYSSLSDVEPKAQMLPLWWAAGTLLGFKESVRVRTDTQNVTSEASANPPGAQQNAGAFFFRQFYASLNQMSRVRRAERAQTTYSE